MQLPCATSAAIANGFTQRRMRVNRLANIHWVTAHLDDQGHFANHVASARANHAIAQYVAVAMRLGAVIKQQLGDAFGTAVGDDPPSSQMGEMPSFFCYSAFQSLYSAIQSNDERSLCPPAPASN